MSGYDPEQRWQLDRDRPLDPHAEDWHEPIQDEPAQALRSGEDRARVAERIAEHLEIIDARLETLAMRMEAVERQVRDQSTQRTNGGAGSRLWSRERRELANPPGEATVDDALRKLGAGESGRGSGG